MKNMSAPRTRNKRALPSVPLTRSGSVDRIVTETPKSTRVTSRKIDLDSRFSDVRKSSLPLLAQKNTTDFESKIRSALPYRLNNQSSASNSSSNTSSPHGSPRINRKLAVAPMVGEIIDKLSTNHDIVTADRTDRKEDTSYTEKKIARVLPMTPRFVGGHTANTDAPCLSQDDGEPKIHKNHNHLHRSEFGCDRDALKSSVTAKKSEINNIPTGFHAKFPETEYVARTPHQPFVTDDSEEGCSVRVGVRVRPLLPREENDPNVKVCISMKGDETTITSDSGMAYDFMYDYSLWSCTLNHPDYIGQKTLYELMARPLLNSAFEGYNTCLFAYGQTGSGKSYSIMGQGNELGVLPRFCQELFERIGVWKELQFSVEISYFEIYNEKIHDLLAPGKKHSGKKIQLRVREHPVLGPFVQDLSTYVASSYADIESWLAVGNSNRATAATGMNDKSSRSHSVFTIVMTQTRTEMFEDSETQMKTTSKINLIDLAGSERASQVMNDQVIKTTEVAALRLKEGGSINKSLHTLGKVISLLSDREVNPKKKLYIPYRDSTLTWLLKDSLGGNSKTAMIANISPANTSFGESLSTLRYAQRARTIVNRAVINEDPNAKIIRELKAEIERLKSTHTEGDQVISVKALTEVALLRDKLKETRLLFAESTRNWQEKLALTEKRKQEEAEKLKKAGISLKVDNRLPNLVNLNEDPQLSEMLLYMLKEGETTVGQSDHDINLSGALVAKSHCVLRNDGETITVSPLDDAPTYVNGQLIGEETVLHHGDRVVIGGDHYFRLNHPIEVKKRKKEIKQGGGTEGINPESVGTKDFEFARNELAQAQNARLQAELEEAREEARIKAQEEVVARIQEAKEAAQCELSEQKQQFEERVCRLEEAMESLSTEKKEAEQSSQSAAEKISELEAHRLLLEQEIINNRKKLQMEALAAKQALEETKMNQVRIITELEKEKKKMQDDVQKLKDAKQHREKVREEFRASFNNIGRKNSLADDPNKKELLRITMSLREANKISQSLGKRISFSRDDVFTDGKSEIKIRLNNTKKGLTTLWSLEKFESAMEHMRELYQQRDNDSVSGESGDETDPFNDPDDKWEKDFKLDSSSSRRISSLGTSALTSRNKPPHSSRPQGFSPDKAESIFAKYRNQPPTLGPNTEGTEAPSKDAGTSFVRPVLEMSSKPPPPTVRRTSVTSNPGPSVSSLCKDSLKDYLKSLQESTEPFNEPLYEKVLRSVRNIKRSLSVIKKAYQEKPAHVGDIQLEPRHICVSITFSAQMLIENVRTWNSVESQNDKFSALCSELDQAVRQLARRIVDILGVFDGSAVNVDDIFTALDDDIGVVVRQTAKMAVLSSQEEHLVDDDDTVGEDGEMNQAFIDGQDLSMETSVLESVSAISELQEQFEAEKMDSSNTEVDRQITEDVLKLIRTTADFIHQGREVQMQLHSPSNKMSRRKEMGRNRLLSVKKYVGGVKTILEKTRQLVSNARNSYDDVDLEKLVSLPEEICLAVRSVLRQKRAFFEVEYSTIKGCTLDGLKDELEYLEEKSEDVESASEDLRRTLKRFLFLSTPKSLQKNQNLRVWRINENLSDDKNDSAVREIRSVVKTPLSSQSRHLTNEKGRQKTRKLWSKESPV